MYAFDFERPATLAETLAALQDAGARQAPTGLRRAGPVIRLTTFGTGEQIECYDA